MLCDDVKRVVYFFLDGSMSDPKKHAFELHLTACPDCEIRISVHRRLRSFIRSRLTTEHASEAFRVRLTQSLRTVAHE